MMERLEQACTTLLQSEMDLAFSYLRLAQAETRGGSAAHAAELIGKAILAHKNVVQDLAGVSMELQDLKRELAGSARELQEAIRSVQRQFSIWQDASPN